MRRSRKKVFVMAVTAGTLLLVSTLVPAAHSAENAVYNRAGALVSRSAAGERAPVVGREGSTGNRTAGSALTWNRWTRVSDTLSDQFEAGDLYLGSDGAIHCAFTGAEDLYIFRKLLYARSSDRNRTWSNPNLVADQTATDYHMLYPEIIKADDGDLWIAYAQYNENFEGLQIRLIRSADGGETFESSARIDDGSPADASRLYPTAARHGDTIYLFWCEVTGPDRLVRFNRSDNGGDSWLSQDQPVNDSYPLRENCQPVPVHDPGTGRLHVIWSTEAGDVYSFSSDDGGSSWNAPVQVNDAAAQTASEAEICIGPDGTLHAVWSDFRSGLDTDVFYTRSTDGGVTWVSPAVKVNDGLADSNQYEPHIDVDPSGGIHVGFLQNVPFDPLVNLYYTRSTDNGQTWPDPDFLVNDLPDLVVPEVPCTFDLVSASGGYCYLAWRDGRNRSDIYCASDFPSVLILSGPGPGPDNPPEVRGFDVNDTSAPVLSFPAYSVDKFGVNVAAGEVVATASTAFIVTAPGPGEVFGPHVRTFNTLGQPVPGADFLAYGTNKFGANISTGNLDGAAPVEYITGAGPGSVFGPHVRAFRHTGSVVEPVPGVNFFAYGTPRWGVNVACGDVDGDGYDEIITGAGPGAVFGPHVRGFEVDGGSVVAPMTGVSFFAYGTPRWGVNVACGDVDGDGFDEIITGAGPGTVFGPHVRGFDVDGGMAAPMAGISFFAYSTQQYGVQVVCGDVDGDGIDEIITTPGPGPAFGAQVRGWNYDGDEITSLLDINFFAFSPSTIHYGARAAVLQY